jgi:hypothetical protein
VIGGNLLPRLSFDIASILVTDLKARIKNRERHGKQEKNMTIQELGSIGEFVAAIATICTLFYLGYQIRESNKVDKGRSYHIAVEQTWHSVLTLVNNSEMREVLFRAEQGEELSEKELYQLGALNVAMVYGFENIFRLKEQGLVDEEVWQNLLQNDLCRWFTIRPNWEFLSNRKGRLTMRFREEVARTIGDIPETP